MTEAPHPIHINFMMACYTSPNPEEELGEAHWGSEGGQSARAWLKKEGLIGDDNRATARGAAWIGFICATPLPEMKWILPERAP